jgi:lambda family phage minor tail protein L
MTVVIREESQQLATSELIELFTLDLTMFGDNVYYFIAANPTSGSIVWQGNTYVPFDLEAEGFELDGKGSAPQPK